MAKGRSERQILEEVDAQARAWATTAGLGGFYDSTFVSDRALNVSVVPAAEPMRFDVSQAGLGAGLRTSNAGPGYHAAAIDLLDALAGACGLTWDWGQQDDHRFDETGYAVTRDFAALQREHASFLRNLMDASLESGADNGAFCVPWGLGLEDGELACPLGFKPVSWRLTVTEAKEAGRLKLARDFFPWWEREIDATFFENMLRCLLWQHVQWRPPASADDSRTLLMIEDAASQLKAMAGKVPTDLRAALKELDEAVRSNEPPSATGIGYRRRPVLHDLFDSWHITLPGTLVEEIADDGAAAHYSGPRAALRVSAITVTSNGDRPQTWPDTVAEAGEVNAHGLSRRVAAAERDGKHMSQFAAVLHEEQDHLCILMLTLTVADANDLSLFDSWLDSVRYRGEDPQRVGRD
jgi:hypothetical protein